MAPIEPQLQAQTVRLRFSQFLLPCALHEQLRDLWLVCTKIRPTRPCTCYVAAHCRSCRAAPSKAHSAGVCTVSRCFAAISCLFSAEATGNLSVTNTWCLVFCGSPFHVLVRFVPMSLATVSPHHHYHRDRPHGAMYDKSNTMGEMDCCKLLLPVAYSYNTKSFTDRRLARKPALMYMHLHGSFLPFWNQASLVTVCNKTNDIK